MNKILKGALISSFIIAVYVVMFHSIYINPHDWGAVAMWLPVYISPIWGIAGLSWYTEKEENN